ncbi:hypothetical protein BCR35DRAFT_335787, partial [Leucosporidium creatinivorum]
RQKDEAVRKNKSVLVRGTDLVVAVGKELRIASLADVKARCSERDEEGTGAYDEEVALGDYKTLLTTPAIPFEIQQLVLNPTSKLLAVIGLHSILVLVLPRKGWSSSVGRSIECRSLAVGSFYHSHPGSPSVAQALWHPWGTSASSLFVLTSDALLREYTISHDVEEPSQTLSFSPTTPSGGGGIPARGGKRFSADEEDAQVAVGMCFGQGEGDWGPLAVFGLMRNGDVLALCPVLPRRATIPTSYLHSLSSFVSSKVDYLALTTSTADDLNTSTTSSHLGTPTKSLALTHRPSSNGTPSRQQKKESSSSNPLSKIYNHQLHYVNSLLRLAQSSSSTAETEEAPNSSTVSILTPHHPTPDPPALQGPFLLQPGSRDLENGVEDPRATDLAYLAYRGEGEEAEQGEAMGVLVVCWNDGKVELGVEGEKVEGKWSAGGAARRETTPRRRKGGFSAYDSDEDEQEEVDAPPTLLIYETISLGLSSLLPPASIDQTLSTTSYPTITLDPLYSSDTIYIKHALGAHCVGIRSWAEGLRKALKSSEEEGEEGEVERELKKGKKSSVAWVLKTVSPAGAQEGKQEGGAGEETTPLIGLNVINDIYLGYSLLLLTDKLQLVAIELSLRVDSALLPSASTSSNGTKALDSSDTKDDSEGYQTLLTTPFHIPSSLTRTTPSSSLARLAPPKTPSKELIITPETLRFLGKSVELVQTEIRDLVTGVDAVQGRLELQMRELSRQLGAVDSLSKLSSPASSSTDLPTRLASAQATQLTLLARTDRLLQRLMDAHSPQLSNFEKKWFEELGRLEREEGGLRERVERSRGRVEALEGMGVGGGESVRENVRREMGLGEEQRRRVERALAEE